MNPEIVCVVAPARFRPGDYVWVRRPHWTPVRGVVLQWIESAQSYQVTVQDEVIHCWPDEIKPRSRE